MYLFSSYQSDLDSEEIAVCVVGGLWSQKRKGVIRELAVYSLRWEQSRWETRILTLELRDRTVISPRKRKIKKCTKDRFSISIPCLKFWYFSKSLLSKEASDISLIYFYWNWLLKILLCSSRWHSFHWNC